MSETGTVYRMKTLMDYSDIDALMAQRSVGSRTGYFAVLDHFIDAIPDKTRELELLAQAGDYRGMVLAIGVLQDELMRIGATIMTWEAERVAVLAHENAPRQACVDETIILTAKLNGLRARLMEARMEDLNGPACSLAQHQPGIVSMAQAGQAKLPSTARPETFEKLLVLVENFELDDTMSILRTMLGHTYGEQIDAALLETYNQLAAFEYDAALSSLNAMLHAIKTREENEKRNTKAILAVDDMPDVLNTVKAVLGGEYTVYAVTNHKAALKFLASKRADLIVLDIEMPQMDGFAMLGIIRRLKAYERTPVLFLTGSDNPENVKRSRSMGANDFIRKPVEAGILLEKVGEHMTVVQG